MDLKMWLAAASALSYIAASGAVSAQGSKHFSGTASYYSRDYQGRVASGGRYDPTELTAAHKTLPFGARVRVTDSKTQRSVTVTITDRGPFTQGRVIDLSLAAAERLGMLGRGLVRVTAEVQPRVFTTAAE